MLLSLTTLVKLVAVLSRHHGFGNAQQYLHMVEALALET